MSIILCIVKIKRQIYLIAPFIPELQPAAHRKLHHAIHTIKLDARNIGNMTQYHGCAQQLQCVPLSLTRVSSHTVHYVSVEYTDPSTVP